MDESTLGKTYDVDGMRLGSSNWSLGNDAEMLNYLMGYSQNLISNISDVQQQLNTVLHNSKLISMQVNSVFMEFIMLANTQFVENRVYDEDITNDKKEVEPEAPVNKEKSKEEVEASVIPKISEALKLGLKVIDKAFEKIEIDDGASDGEDEATGFKADPIFEAKDPYLNRPMPYLIGSVAFNQDDDVGLIDYISDEENKIEEEASASESESSDTESHESDPDTTDNDSQSVSSQESDLFHSDEEKENNDLFSSVQSHQYEEPELEQSISSQVKQKEGRDKNANKQSHSSKQGLVVKDLDDLFNTEKQNLDDNSSESDDHGLFSSKDKGDLFNDFEDEYEDTSAPFDPPKVVKPPESSKESKPQQKKKTKEFGADLFGDSDDDIFTIGDKPSQQRPVEASNLFSGSNEDIFSLPNQPEPGSISDSLQKDSTVHVESVEGPNSRSKGHESGHTKSEKKLPVGAVPLFGSGSNPIVKALKKRPELFEDADEISPGSPSSTRKSEVLDSASSEDELFKTEPDTTHNKKKSTEKIKDADGLKFKSPVIRSDSLSSEDDLFKAKTNPAVAKKQNVDSIKKDDKFKSQPPVNISKVEKSDSLSSEDDLFSIKPSAVKSKKTNVESVEKDENKFKFNTQPPFPQTARSDSLSSEDDLFKEKPDTSKPTVKLAENKTERQKKSNLGLFFENNTEDADDLFNIKDELNAKLAAKPVKPMSKKSANVNVAPANAAPPNTAPSNAATSNVAPVNATPVNTTPVPHAQQYNSSAQTVSSTTKDKGLFSSTLEKSKPEPKSESRPVIESIQEKAPVQTLPSLTKSRARLPRNRRPPTRQGKPSNLSSLPNLEADQVPKNSNINNIAPGDNSAEVSRPVIRERETVNSDNPGKGTSNAFSEIFDEDNDLPNFSITKTNKTEQSSIFPNHQQNDTNKKKLNIDQNPSKQSSLDRPTTSIGVSDTTSKVQSWLDKNEPVVKQSGKSLFEDDEDDDIFATNLTGMKTDNSSNNKNIDDIFSSPLGKSENQTSALKTNTKPVQQNKTTKVHPVKPVSEVKSGDNDDSDDIFNAVPVKRSQELNRSEPTIPISLGSHADDDIFNVKKTEEKTPIIKRVIDDDDDIFNVVPVIKTQELVPPLGGEKPKAVSYQSPAFPDVLSKEDDDDDIFNTTPVKRHRELTLPDPEIVKEQSNRKQPFNKASEDDIFNVIVKSKPAEQNITKPDVVDLFDEENTDQNTKSLAIHYRSTTLLKTIGNIFNDETGDDIFSDVPSQANTQTEEARQSTTDSHHPKKSKKRPTKTVKDEDIFKDDINIFADFQDNSEKKEKTVKSKKVNRKKATPVTEDIDDIFGNNMKQPTEKKKKVQKTEKFKDPLNVFDD